jgi:hypothetical protein
MDDADQVAMQAPAAIDMVFRSKRSRGIYNQGLQNMKGYLTPR